MSKKKTKNITISIWSMENTNQLKGSNKEITEYKKKIQTQIFTNICFHNKVQKYYTSKHIYTLAHLAHLKHQTEFGN